MTRHRLLKSLLVGWLVWQYEAHPNLAMFLLYTHLPGQVYDWNRASYSVLSLDGQVTVEIDCRLMTLMAPGPWTAVLKAFGMDGEQSEASNEVTFSWSQDEGCTTTGTVPPPGSSRRSPRPAPVVYTPPIMPTFPDPSPPVLPMPDPPASGGDITQTCTWGVRSCW